MERPVDDIEGCRRAHERLGAITAALDDEVVRRPSLLDSWTVGHVLSHLARNAEAMVRRIEATQHGKLIDQYVGGAKGRSAAIDSGAAQSASELIDDVSVWSARLDDTFASLPGEAWRLQVRTVGGSAHPVAALPYRRWREVEVHIVDLDVGVTTEEWSAAFVERALPNLIDNLQQRSDDRALMAWILGRGDAPDLGRWG